NYIISISITILKIGIVLISITFVIVSIIVGILIKAIYRDTHCGSTFFNNCGLTLIIMSLIMWAKFIRPHWFPIRLLLIIGWLFIHFVWQIFFFLINL